MTKAQRQIKGFKPRLEKAEKALASLALKPGQDVKALQEKVDRILKHHRVSEYLNVTINLPDTLFQSLSGFWSSQ